MTAHSNHPNQKVPSPGLVHVRSSPETAGEKACFSIGSSISVSQQLCHCPPKGVNEVTRRSISSNPLDSFVTKPGQIIALNDRIDSWAKLFFPKTIPFVMCGYQTPFEAENQSIEWHHSFGWRQDRASLDTFEASFRGLPIDQAAHLTQVYLALSEFQRRLDASFSRQDLYAQSSVLRHFPDVALRDDLRFFFNVAAANEGTIIVTLFLEATVSEIQERPTNYRNTDKHLHHAFVTEAGAIRKIRACFQRDRNLADTTEHTAYAQVFIRPFASQSIPKGISLLLHPLQRVRLGYQHSLDPQVPGYKEKMCLLAHNLISLGAKLGREPQGISSAAIAALKEVGSAFNLLSRHGIRPSVHPDVGAVLNTIERYLRLIPNHPALEIKPDHRSHWRGNTVRQSIIKGLAYSLQVARMAEKKSVLHEAHYTSADQITGPRRELLFLGVSDILRESFIQTTGLPTFRYVLSPKQVDKIPLSVRHRDAHVREVIEAGIRHRIREVSEKLAQFYPTEEGMFYVERPNADGRFIDEYRQELWGQELVEFLSLDRGKRVEG